MELVDKEVVAKQKELMVGTPKGVLKAKVEHMASRAVPEIHFPHGWLQVEVWDGTVGLIGKKK